MIKHLGDLGLLTPKLSCAHTIWIDDDDIALMAERGAVVIHNPESNMRGGSGIAPIPAMLAHGLTVGLGNDGSCSGGDQVLQRAMRLATILHRSGEPDPTKWVSTRQALAMATRGGAAAMPGRDACGSIAVGQAADMGLYDLTRPWWTPLNDPVHQFVYSETGSGLDTLIVDGRVLVEGREIIAFDADAILVEARDMMPAIKERNRDLFDLVERVGQAVI
jgi:cytosine/adenosine deaminase-related metal-dependent hydrolase